MTGQESKELGQRLFKERQYAAATRVLAAAVEHFATDETLWQELVLSASQSEQHESAVEFAKSAIHNHPRSGWLWRQLGNELTLIGRLDEAEKVLNNARTLLGESDDWLWRYYAALHRKQNNLEREIQAWENLHAFGDANSNDLNSLGIAYHDQKNFGKALEYYRLSAADEASVAPLFNMGLVFNDPEVSQDADAADAYRRALALNPNYERAKERLDATIRKLAPLAERARTAAAGLVRPDELFQFYVSPFEVLQVQEIEAVEELDVKTIQRAKKRLLQEIDLNDGKVSWLDDYPLDKSRALAMEDELHDETKRAYHWAVFCNKRLLRFLTRGDIGHFYSSDYFPRESLELLDEEPDFRAFLSKPFARQYNLVLTRAIERRLLPVIEVLFDGRRWVEPEDEDVCFEGAYKRIADLVEAMRSKVNVGRERKVSVRELEDFLREHSLPELFNLLPTPFASAQRDLVAGIRSLAISCFNQHGDSDLSKAVLNLCKRFTTRSVELTKRLEEDFLTIERMIAEERKHESRLHFGPDRPFEITKEGIRDGAKFFPADTVESLRWGITVTGYTGAERLNYFLGVRRIPIHHNAVLHPDNWIDASWSTDKAGEEKQTAHFSAMVNAALNYLGAIVAEKLHKQLAAGLQLTIGPCQLTLQGIAFQTKGLIFKRERFVQWCNVATKIQNGQVILSSSAESGVSVAMSMRDTENAVLLPIINAMMKREQNKPPPLPNHGN